MQVPRMAGNLLAVLAGGSDWAAEIDGVLKPILSWAYMPASSQLV